jgi:hypothetical protein
MNMKRKGMAWFLSISAILLLTAVGINASAKTVQIGDQMVSDYSVRWSWSTPTIRPYIGNGCHADTDDSLWVSISNLGFGQKTWLQTIVDGNQLIDTRLVGNGIYQIPLPSMYNGGQWRTGNQNVLFVLSSTERFVLADNVYRPALVGTFNFTGYPCSGYVVVSQLNFAVHSDCCTPCWCCCH